MLRPRLLVLLGLGGWLATGLVLWACGDRARPGPEEGPEEPAGETGAVAQREWQAYFRPPTDRIPKELASNPGTPWGDYVGSTACKDCHPKDYAGWRDSFHSRTLYDARQETVFADFSGKVSFTDPKYPFRVYPLTKDGRFLFRIDRNPDFQDVKVVVDPLDPARSQDGPHSYGHGVPPFPTGDYEVLYSFGNRRHQPFVVRANDGRHWVPPVYWNDVMKSWEWDDWRPYAVTCANCHVTGIKSTTEEKGKLDRFGLSMPPRWNLSPEQEGWAEGAVGCEVCHGPGRPHIETVRRMGDAPYRAYLAAGGAPTIYNPAKDTPKRRMQQCDACHNFFTESSVSWIPGPDGYDHDPVSIPIRPSGSKADSAQFYPNGVDMSPCTVGTVFRASKMGRSGVECQACHDPHGNSNWAELVRPIEHNELCLMCHEADKSGHFRDELSVAQHAHHKPGGPGVLCVECHMPRDKHFTNGVHVMSAKIHSHAFSIPTGHESDGGGPASSCNLCHTDKSAAWTVQTLAKWKREAAIAPGATTPAKAVPPLGK